jgi:hypothetical protein
LDVPPYVNSADRSGAVPFLDIANQYILAGAQYDPTWPPLWRREPIGTCIRFS